MFALANRAVGHSRICRRSRGNLTPTPYRLSHMVRRRTRALLALLPVGVLLIGCSGSRISEPDQRLVELPELGVSVVALVISRDELALEAHVKTGLYAPDCGPFTARAIETGESVVLVVEGRVQRTVGHNDPTAGAIPWCEESATAELQSPLGDRELLFSGTNVLREEGKPVLSHLPSRVACLPPEPAAVEEDTWTITCDDYFGAGVSVTVTDRPASDARPPVPFVRSVTVHDRDAELYEALGGLTVVWEENGRALRINLRSSLLNTDAPEAELLRIAEGLTHVNR